MTFRDELIAHYQEIRQRLVDVPPPPETPPKFRPAVRYRLPPVITLADVAWARYLHGGWLAGPPEAWQPALTLKRIHAAVCRHYGIKAADLFSERRTHDLIRPRHVALYLAKALTFKSLAEIGRRYGRDHTSVISAVNRITRLMHTDAQLAADVAAIRKTLEGA